MIMGVYLWIIVVCVTLFLSPSLSSPPPSLLFVYGRHFPNGQAAVDYIYSDVGMWKNFTPAQYLWNYYNYSNLPPDHPYNMSGLIEYSTGSHVTTCLDANEHLLLDYNHDGEIDTTDGGFSFHEHSGRGVGDALIDKPFNNFWFDDNSPCIYMSAAYGRQLPNGLSNYTDFTRWRIVGGDPDYWQPYPPSFYIDQLALNGLFYITQNNYPEAMSKWKDIIAISNAVWNSTSLQYEYPGVTATYYFGLIAILTNFLRVMAPSYSDATLLLQHSISLRSNILSLQVINSTTGDFCSWCTNIPAGGSVQNAETTACNTLGLGAASMQVFEVGTEPLVNDGYFILQPFHVLSAIAGKSHAGFMSLGPYWTYPLGNYTAEFILRSSSPLGDIATLDIFDEDITKVLIEEEVTGSLLLPANQWVAFQLSFEITNPSNLMEFRILWHGSTDLDASIIRIL